MSELMNTSSNCNAALQLRKEMIMKNEAELGG